jgi:hypothetical protein
MRIDPSRWPQAAVAVLVLATGPDAAAAFSCPAGEAVAAPDLPPAAELEQRGTRIGAIEITIEDIFDPSKPEESAAPYRWTNDLHYATREEAIRSQLLFREDEAYSQQKIEETERLLRGRRYLFDAWIEPACYHPAEQAVDLRVRVRDVWSLNPGIHFSRKGGANNAGFGLQDQDFLGRGELVEISWARNVDRDSLQLLYDDPQLLGSWWRGRAAFSDNSDGRSADLKVEHPFYSLDTRWAAGTQLTAGDRVDTRYQQGHELDSYAERLERFEVYAGRSSGLHDGWSRRTLAGLRYEHSDFTALDDVLPAGPLPEERTLVYPWIGAEWVENDFSKAHNKDQLARTEDLKFGRSLHAEFGLATPAWGADRTAAILALGGDGGRRLGDSRSLFYGGRLSGRLESGGLQDGLLQADARYYHQQRPQLLFFAGASAAVAEHPDADHQLLLGGDNGLRGYPLRYQSGTESLLLTAEERIFTSWFPFRLFNVGAAAFTDVGRTWGRDITGEEPLGWLADVGVGLRIGNTRTGLGNVLHVDVAVPLVSQPGLDSVQLIVETRHSF